TSHSGAETYAEAVFSELASDGGVAAGPLTSAEIGLTGNAAAPMTLVLEDASGASAAVMNPDPAAAQQTSATDFVVDFRDVGIDLTAVTKVSLVIGDGTAGGSGSLIINNVRLLGKIPLIAWVSYHAADDEPHADAAAHGFTQAPDIEYTDLLKAQGYNIVRVVTSQSPDVEYLNTMDLVIISRTASSGHYSGSGASLWNSVVTPTINLNGYTLRSSRMGFTDGTTMVDTTGDVKLAVTDPAHPIFAGIALTDGVMDNPFAEGAVPLPTDETIISRGISINNNAIDEEGTVLATIAEASADTGPVGAMMIAEYPAGATMQNSSGSPDDVLGGPRLVFLTGSREPSGVTGGQAAALYDLYADGEQMFLNAVSYMLGD
ncbi:MAG: hypothetical protein ACYTFQ_16985, partial [Planctomycetota bacterium]